MMNELLILIKAARFIWICGNGGSAACAEHFATDLVKKGYRAIALSSNTSVITMIGNDEGYQYIFSEQLKVYATKDDLVITISCSGVSPNIIAIDDMAHLMGFKIYAFETFSNDRDYGKLENKHLKLAHKIAKSL